MRHIHWLGAGLSSLPGIRRMATSNNKLTVWNRTLSKAEFSINHVKSDYIIAKKLDLNHLYSSLKNGDIVVSQLTANMHTEVAKICLEKECHFVSSSYISSDLKKLDKEAKDKNLVFINEIGLDPGIDHFFSHLLVNELTTKKLNNFSVSYKSFCGGITATPNDFRYKFSWSPIGVIKALSNKAKFIENYNKKVATPFHHVNLYSVNGENFEAYPNRDSLPYLEEYSFPPNWIIKDFIRGTLRLKGWSEAWKDIFAMLESSSSNLDSEIQIKSDELWSKYQYEKNEKDRVVLSVSLKAISEDNQILWSGCYELDETGSGENTAMAVLVSITLSAGIDLILQKKLNAGVQAAPHNKDNIEYFFAILKDYNIKIKKNNE
jgi:saccharopine dehydrogenase-like NADP-dependent oxidoreductase